VRSALDWLVRHHRLDRVPGFPAEPDARWDLAMVHYYAAASAQVFARLQPDLPWRAPLTERLRATQRPDGSWANEVSLMKEDDPLIATSLSLIALAAALNEPAAASKP
jgi:hypothetical protein